MRFLLLASITGFIITTSCKNDFRCLDKYNKVELSFFSQTGFIKPQDILLKWDDSIKIGVKGNPTKRDLEIIDTIIKEVAPLMGSIKFKMVDVNENFLNFIYE